MSTGDVVEKDSDLVGAGRAVGRLLDSEDDCPWVPGALSCGCSDPKSIVAGGPICDEFASETDSAPSTGIMSRRNAATSLVDRTSFPAFLEPWMRSVLFPTTTVQYSASWPS